MEVASSRGWGAHGGDRRDAEMGAKANRGIYPQICGGGGGDGSVQYPGVRSRMGRNEWPRRWAPTQTMGRGEGLGFLLDGVGDMGYKLFT